MIGHFQENASSNEAIWAEISSQEAQNNAFVENCWAEYQQEPVAGPSDAAQMVGDEFGDPVDDKFVYSKVISLNYISLL